VTGTAVTWNGE